MNTGRELIAVKAGIYLGEADVCIRISSIKINFEYFHRLQFF
jgi:hypothetical protein